MKLPHYSLIAFLLISSIPSYANTLKQQPLKHTSANHLAVKKDESSRKLWSLSTQEWTRYKSLLNGIRGSISPATISPIEVLGVHARTDQERRKYAELWAMMMREDVERTIAFQRAYDEANIKLYPNESLFSSDALALKQPKVFKTGDRVLVFIKMNKCPECVQMIQRLLLEEKVRKLTLDIYFIDTKSKQDNTAIRQWAENQNIDKSRLKSGKVTLNHDNGNLYKITKQLINKVPLVYTLNKKTITQIHY
jgi:integrating conjugative element protein (TIGR03759 family)